MLSSNNSWYKGLCRVGSVLFKKYTGKSINVVDIKNMECQEGPLCKQVSRSQAQGQQRGFQGQKEKVEKPAADRAVEEP